MELNKVTRLCCILIILAAIALLDHAIAAETQSGMDLKVLDGKG